ncbi:phage tail protein [Sphingobium sp. AN558]|uniref:phage tail protein n=1 Tax=Sphingobium sp. AN558 TaxID=3133442 RepID=UPI0030C3A8F0
MATLVLTAVGSVFGPIGAALGGLIGNAFDHAVLFKPKGREGPRLNDLQLQTSTYGSQIPKLFGTIRVAGTVVWATDLRETKSKSGGGKGRPSVTTYAYSASFAVALSARQVRSVKRIWADGNLLRGAAGDFKTELGAFRLHDGGEDQPVDPLIASAQGVARTSAHRGVAYALFEDLALADYGNRIPSLTFEVEADDGAMSIGEIASVLSEGALSGAGLASVDGYAAEGRDIGEAIAPLIEAQGLALLASEDGLVLEAAALTGEGEIGGEILCRAVNGRALDAIERSVEAAETAPVALSMRYYDAERDYRTGVQRSTRPGPGRAERGVDLPAVLSADAARGLTGRRLGEMWTGRATMTLRCGWEALAFEPGTVVTVEGESGLWRIEEREWEAMAVRLALRRTRGVGGSVPVGASSGVIVRQTDAPHGQTTLMLADLPALKDGVASAPAVVAAASGGPGWRSAALFATSASGEAVPIGRTPLRAVMGTLDAALDAGSITLVDEKNSMTVTLLAEDMLLLPADEAALSLGRNLCLVGKELIQFGHAVQIGPARFRLSRLRRGLRGTEWAMGQASGAAFLVLEEDRVIDPLAAMGMDGDIGEPVRLAAIGIGDVEPAEAAVTLTGEALIPPSPVHLTARAQSGGWVIGWTRRSRAGWRWSSGSDVPLAEESERYALRIMDGAVPIRSAESVLPVWSYDSAMIADDGASGTVTVEIRQIGARAMGRAATIMINL